MTLPKSLSQVAQVVIDSYFVIDLEHNIVDFNRTFHSMLPRPVARNLKTKKCHEVLNLEICKDNCIAKACWEAQRAIRLDEIRGRVAGEGDELIFILSAIPIFDESGRMIGAMEMQRNVTDEAQVQVKYQQQMDAAADEKKRLDSELQARTRRLFEVSHRMYALQREILRLKTGA